MPFSLPQLPLEEPAWVFAAVTLLVLAAPIVARWMRLPDVVVLVVAGTLVGAGGVALLEREGAIALVGGVGLLYLMFAAGLELDLDEFVAHQGDSWRFGSLTFAVPMVLGTLGAAVLGYPVLAAVLLGSCWASHTLVSYPIFQRFSVVRQRAVSTTVGATIITDTAALLVLAVVAGMHRGTIGWTFWVGLVSGMVALTAFFVAVLPWLGRWFFAGLGQDQTARFFFLMVAMALSAGLAEVAGIEAIVGAFAAGLALNKLVPKQGPLMDRIEFLGSRILVPVFLISVGMLIDPLAAVTDVRTLLIAGVFVGTALSSKLVAAWLAGKWLGYSGTEIGGMFGLSVNQAAATLAAVIVGVNIGLLDEVTVRAVVLVILISCLTGSWMSARYAPRLIQPSTKAPPLGQTVVVPVANPANAEQLVGLAAEFCRAAAGSMIPLTVVDPGVSSEGLEVQRELNARAETLGRAKAVESHGLVRIDSSPAEGTLHTIVEYDATLVILGWKGFSAAGENFFGGIIDHVLSQTGCPAIVARLRPAPYQRVILVVNEAHLSPAGLPSTRRAAEVARILSRVRAATKPARRGSERELLVVTDIPSADESRLAPILEDIGEHQRIHDQRRPAISLRQIAGPEDLIIFPAIPTYQTLRGDAARVARAVTETSILVVLDSGRRL